MMAVVVIVAVHVSCCKSPIDITLLIKDTTMIKKTYQMASPSSDMATWRGVVVVVLSFVVGDTTTRCGDGRRQCRRRAVIRGRSRSSRRPT